MKTFTRLSLVFAVLLLMATSATAQLYVDSLPIEDFSIIEVFPDEQSKPKKTELSNSNLAPIPEILAYPNPVASAPFVRVSYDNVFEPSTVQIVDASGRLYREDTFEPAASGNGIFALKVDNLASGLYIVKLVNRVSKASTKLLIQR